MEKEVKITREFSFIPDPKHDNRVKEIRHYWNEKLVARYGSVYDDNGNCIGVRELRVEDVIPLGLLDKVKKAIWKKPERLDYLNWLGLINYIGTINTINKIKTIEKIEHIETIGKDNILVDLLKSGAYIEDRRTISNNGTTPAWCGWAIGNNRSAKFFTRGCMGFIETIEVYCKDIGVAGGTITVYISPNPSLGYVAKADITVPAEGVAEWRSATFNRMWLSDKLFVFYVISEGIEVAQDDNLPYDRYISSDAGATWATQDYRVWLKVVMKGQSVVILPVGGTVNTIEIPHVSDERLYVDTPLDSDDEKTIKEIHGAGELEYIDYRMEANTDSDRISCRVYCDDKCAFAWDAYNLDHAGYTATTEGIALLKYAVNGFCYIHVMLKFNFQRNLKITMRRKEGSPNQAIRIEGLVNLIK